MADLSGFEKGQIVGDRLVEASVKKFAILIRPDGISEQRRSFAR
jgi:hypothetical protein